MAIPYQLNNQEGEYAMWDPYADFQKLTLTNGLNVYVSQVEREFEIFGFLIHAGAREDRAGKEGVAHFVEHCVGEGIPGLTSEDIQIYFEKQGGFANLGSTGYLQTGYMIKCQAGAEHLTRSLEIFGRLLLRPNFFLGIEKEREIIVQEYNSKYGYSFQPELILQTRKSVFPGHRMANFLRPLGHLSAIQSMSQSDLEEFHDKYYVPANMSIVAVGKLFPEQVTTLLEKSPFGIKKAGRRNTAPPPNFPDHSRLTRYDIKWSLLLNSGTNKMTRGQYESWAALPGALNEEVVTFARNLLERKLIKQVREERGWCYGMDLSYHTLQDLYEFNFDVPIKLEALPHIEELVDHCIATALDDRNYFEELKEIAVNDLLLNDIACHKICRGSMNDLGCAGRIISFAEIAEIRKAITVSNIAEVLGYLKPEKRLTIITYP